MSEPVTEASAVYYAFWSYWLKVLVVLGSLWGAVIEGTLLSIRVAQDQPKVQTIEFEVLPQSHPVFAGGSLASVLVSARSLAPSASLAPVRSRLAASTDPGWWSVP